MLDIGIKPEILAGNIIGVVAQRLVRKLCGDCKDSIEMKSPFTDSRTTDEQLIVYRPAGCPACADQGYRGRMALMEILLFEPDMDELVARRGTPRELYCMALEKGFKSLADAGMSKIVEGTTSLEEVARVVDLYNTREQYA